MDDAPHLNPVQANRERPSGGLVADHAGWVAAASAALGVVGVVALPVIASIGAIILGYVSRRAIDRTGRDVGMRTWATVGIWTGWIGVLFGVLLVLLFALGIIGGIMLLV